MRQANPTPQAHGRYTFGSGARPLDGYTIKRAIGRGGFGEVYYATSDSGKEVALKLILRNLDVERRGVMQCMNLKCPNLLTIFDLKTNDAGDTFVVMEYVAGPSLASVLKQYPDGMPLAEVRHWLKGLVEGVAYLHDHGIVHRDLKPANLFMEEGIVKIGDYGLAKLITPSQGTEHSESIGTCHYMAPEIGSGKYNKPIDVYAIGVILYEMLTGRVPFEGETVNEVLMKHLTARPDVSMLPEPYRTIVAKALAKDPNQRPSRVYDLLPPERRAARAARSGSSARARRAAAPGPRPAGRRPAGGGRPADRGRGAGLLHRPRDAPAPAARARTWRSGCGPTGRHCGPGPQRRAAPGRRSVQRRRTSLRPPRPTPAGARAAARPAARAARPSRPPRRRRRRRPAARAAADAQRAGPVRRAGQPRCSGPPRSWPCWPSPPPPRWSIDPSRQPAASWLTSTHGPAGDLDGPHPRQGPRDAPARRRQPPADRPGGRVGSPASPGSAWRGSLRLDLAPQHEFFEQPAGPDAASISRPCSRSWRAGRP